MSGRIFGGFLMRRAFELAFACAYTFAGWRPQFVRCEEVRCFTTGPWSESRF